MNFSHEKETIQMMNYYMLSKSLKKKEKSKNNQQQIKPKNKERIEVIREEPKELANMTATGLEPTTT